MTILALKSSRRANAVSSLHGQVSRAMWTGLFPGRNEEAVPIVSSGAFGVVVRTPTRAFVVSAKKAGVAPEPNFVFPDPVCSPFALISHVVTPFGSCTFWTAVEYERPTATVSAIPPPAASTFQFFASWLKLMRVGAMPAAYHSPRYLR